MSLVTTVEPQTVPKPKPDKPKRDDISVKVDKEVIRLARTIAAFRDLNLAEYLSETLRPIVTRDVDAIHHKPRRKPPEDSP